MAKDKNDVIGQLLQEVFSNKDGMKRFLEVVVNQAMQGEVAQQLEAEEYQRNEPPYLITIANVITCGNQPIS